MKCSLDISTFLEEISSLSHSIVLLYFFALITEEGFLISPCYSWNSAFRCLYLFFSPFPFASLLFSAICNWLPLQTTSLPCCISSSWGYFWPPPPVKCYKPLPIVLQALYLLDLIPWICFCHCIITGDLILIIPEWSGGFPYFLQFKFDLAFRSSWCEPQPGPGLVFADCIELLHLQIQRM